jgi:hexokinase
MMLLEGLRQNYGVAQDYSSQYFDKLRETSERVENFTLKTSLQELLNSRDTVTAALSKADPASASQLQAIFAKTQAATKGQP